MDQRPKSRRSGFWSHMRHDKDAQQGQNLISERCRGCHSLEFRSLVVRGEREQPECNTFSHYNYLPTLAMNWMKFRKSGAGNDEEKKQEFVEEQRNSMQEWDRKQVRKQKVYL